MSQDLHNSQQLAAAVAAGTTDQEPQDLVVFNISSSRQQQQQQREGEAASIADTRCNAVQCVQDLHDAPAQLLEVQEALQKMHGQLADGMRCVQDQYAAALQGAEEKRRLLLRRYQEQQQQLEQQEKVVEAKKGNCDELKEQCEVLAMEGREQRQQQEQEREGSKQQVAALASRVVGLREACSGLESNLAVVKDELTSSSKEFAKLQQVAQRKVAVAGRKVKVTQKKLAVAKQRLHKAAGEGKMKRQQVLVELQQQLQQSEAVAGELQQQLVSRDAEVQQLVAAVAEQQRVLEEAVARAWEIAGFSEALGMGLRGSGVQVGVIEAAAASAPVGCTLRSKRTQGGKNSSSSSSSSSGGLSCRSRDYVELLGRASSLGITCLSRPTTADASLMKPDQQQQQQQQQEEGMKKSMRTMSAPDMLTLCCSSGLTVDLPAAGAVAELPWGSEDGVKARVLVLEQRDSPKAGASSPSLSYDAMGLPSPAFDRASNGCSRFSTGGGAAAEDSGSSSNRGGVDAPGTATAIEVLGMAVASAAEALSRSSRQVSLLTQQSSGLQQQLQQVAAAAAVAGELLEQQAAAAGAADSAWVAERCLLVEMKQKMQQERAAAQQELNRGRIQLEGMVQERNSAAAQRMTTHHHLIAAQQQVEEQERKLVGFKEQVSEQEVQVVGFKAQVRELQEQVAVAQKAGVQLQQQLEEREQQAEELQVQVGQLQQQLLEAQVLVLAARGREEELQKELELLGAVVVEGQEVLRAAKLREGEMEQQLRLLQQQLWDESAAVAAAGEMKGQLQRELGELQQQYADATAEVEMVKVREESLREAQRQMSGQLGLAIRHLEEGGLGATGLRARLEGLAEEMAVQLGLLVVEREERVVEAEQWRNEVAAKKLQLQEMQEAAAAVERKVGDLQQQLEMALEEVEVAKGEVREVTGKLGASEGRERELRGQLLGLEGELVGMREREGELERQLAGLRQQLSLGQQQQQQPSVPLVGRRQSGKVELAAGSSAQTASEAPATEEVPEAVTLSDDAGLISAATAAVDNYDGHCYEFGSEHDPSLLQQLSDAEEDLTVEALTNVNDRLTAATQKQLEAEQEVRRAQTVQELQEEQLQELRQQLTAKEQQVAALQQALVSSQMGLLQMHSSLGQAKASLKGVTAGSPGHRSPVTSGGGRGGRRLSGSNGGGDVGVEREGEVVEWGPWMGGGDEEAAGDGIGTRRVWKVSGCFGEGGLIYDNPLGQAGAAGEEGLAFEESHAGGNSIILNEDEVTMVVLNSTCSTAATEGHEEGDRYRMSFIAPSSSSSSNRPSGDDICNSSSSSSLHAAAEMGEIMSSTISFVSPLPRITAIAGTKQLLGSSLSGDVGCSSSSMGGGSSSSSVEFLGRTISAVKGPGTPQAAIVYQNSRSFNQGSTGNVSIWRRPCWPSEEGGGGGGTSEAGDNTGDSAGDTSDRVLCGQVKGRVLMRDTTMQKHSFAGSEEGLEVMLPCAPYLEGN